jgi:hypothetical protein
MRFKYDKANGKKRGIVEVLKQPTLAQGFPSNLTTSAVKALSPPIWFFLTP